MYKPSKPYKKQIISAVRKTWKTPYVSVTFNTYPIFKRKFSYAEVDHTDGTGTKGIYHWRKGTFKAAVLDALAMNLNDLAIVGATPYKVSNHVMVPVEDRRVLTIVEELAKECKKRKLAITGGENSFHDNMEGLDISMTVSGFVKKPRPANQLKVGDVLIGLKSSGLHSNGFTRVRKVFKKEFRSDFVVPTKIYSDAILSLLKKHKVNGMMHITGGAFTKLKDLLKGADAVIHHPPSLRPHKIFYELSRRGVSDADMYATFNCGIGFVLSVPKKEADAIVRKTKDAAIIGKVVKGSGKVRIASMFSRKVVSL